MSGNPNDSNPQNPSQSQDPDQQSTPPAAQQARGGGRRRSQDDERSPEDSRAMNIKSFVVEFGDNNNRSQSLNTFRMRVRGAFSIQRLHTREQGGRDVGEMMSKMPEVPGQRLFVDPASKLAVLFDPLEDKDLADRVANGLVKAHLASRDTRIKPVPKTELKCNIDQMKSLLIDLLFLQESKSITVVTGDLPTAEQVERYPGRRLEDPWSNNNKKPKYADEQEEWARNLEASAIHYG